MEPLIIKQIDHDNLENRNPIRMTILGVIISENVELDAINYIDKMMAKSVVYKGYDGKEYPQYITEKIKILKS